MSVRIVQEQGPSLDEAMAPLLAEEPYLAYANFPPIAERIGSLHELYRSRWQAAAGGEGVLVARAAGRPVASLALRRRDFESRHFGRRMAGIELPLAVPGEEERLAALRQLYGAAFELLAARGYDHVSTECSAHDRAAAWVLQERGAFHVGTRISWMQSLTGSGSPAASLAPGLRIEHFDRESVRRLPRSAWARLHEWSAQAFDRGPYVFDLSVPLERSRQVYQVWTEKAFTGEWADVVIVVRDGDEVVSFHTMLLLPELSEAAGVGILGRGIGGTLPGYRGLFTALQRETSASQPLGARYLENETQASTVGSIQVFGKLGHHCYRSSAIFHVSFSAAPRGATHEGA